MTAPLNKVNRILEGKEKEYYCSFGGGSPISTQAAFIPEGHRNKQAAEFFNH
jgi:hypothetical protein